jgi:hypothetical protein
MADKVLINARAGLRSEEQEHWVEVEWRHNSLSNQLEASSLDPSRRANLKAHPFMSMPLVFE